MICYDCKSGASFHESNDLDQAVRCHARCQGDSHCDCQHRVFVTWEGCEDIAKETANETREQ